MLQSATERARRARHLLIVLVVVGAAGCGAPPLDKQLESLQSWTATLQLAKEQHGSGAITTTYATQLRDGARSALQEATQNGGASAKSRVDSSYAAAALDSLRGAIRQLEAEVGS